MTRLDPDGESGMDSFASLLDSSFSPKKNLDGCLIQGTVISIVGDSAVIDVGLKSEGRVSLKELLGRGRTEDIRVGDTLNVYVERFEDRSGEIVLSVEKARREEAWERLGKACEKAEFVNGVIFGKVKGGFAVDLGGAVAFLPGSQVDIRPVRDIAPLFNISQPFVVLKMDRLRNNIVVSRRAVLEESRSEARNELISQLSEGQILSGVVKNITDYGAFIDLGGIDGLLHVTDISWKRINHPSEVLKLGDVVEVQVIRFNKETQRISLGMKQLGNDPWQGIEDRFVVGSRHIGKVTNLTDYGAFVELEEGIEGLIYVTELSWTRKNIHPSKVLEVGQDVEITVLEVDSKKRRMGLGFKQCLDNPWKSFKDAHPIGSVVEGNVKNVTEFGIFVGLNEDLDGMVHLSDVSWEGIEEDIPGKFPKGMMLSVKILDIDPDKERISLGIKQLSFDPFESGVVGLKKGERVTCKVVKIVENKGIEVVCGQGAPGFIRKADLSSDRDQQKLEHFAVGREIEAKILSIDHSERYVMLSIKALELADQEEVMKQYGGAESGATLGMVLEEAMKKKND